MHARHWSAVAENMTKLSNRAADFDLDKVTEPLRSYYTHGNHDGIERPVTHRWRIPFRGFNNSRTVVGCTDPP